MNSLDGRTAHLAWRRHGDHPQILLLHGFTDSGHCWDPLIGRLGRDLITLDARGHGGSDLPDESFSYADQADDAALVLDELALGPIVVMGHSMGAFNAATLAGRRPDLVRALVLEDPPPGGRPANPDGRAMDDGLIRLRSQDLESAIETGRREHPKWPADEIEPWARSKQELDPGLFGRPTPEMPLITEVLGAVSCPVLLLRGDTELGGLISADMAAECARAADAPVTLAHLPGTGHSVRREDREGYLSAVIDFVEGLPALE